MWYLLLTFLSISFPFTCRSLFSLFSLSLLLLFLFSIEFQSSGMWYFPLIFSSLFLLCRFSVNYSNSHLILIFHNYRRLNQLCSLHFCFLSYWFLFLLYSIVIFLMFTHNVKLNSQFFTLSSLLLLTRITHIPWCRHTLSIQFCVAAPDDDTLPQQTTPVETNGY